MADFIPTVTRDSNGFLMLNWPTNQRGETMVAREVMVQMVDDLNRLRAEVRRKADYAERMDALAEERLIGWNRERALADQLAQALRWSWELEDATHDEVFGVMASAANALAAYKRDREGK